MTGYASFLAVTVVLFASFKVMGEQAPRVDVGEISELNGVARIVRDEAETAKLKADIRSYDTLETSNGRMAVTFLDDTLIRLTEHSQVLIDEFVFDPDPNKSKMALNLSQGSSLKFYTSDRFAQLVGNGILTFVDEKTQLNKLFSNKEVVFYKDVRDLSLKLNEYKVNDKLRNRIANNGMKKYHKYMNSLTVSKYMINKTFDINKKEKFFWENK